jgi:acyl-CoA synthetase (AMP-forming)/AMP-acid ligase II
MAEVEASAAAATSPRLNVADRLAEIAARSPERVAVVCQRRRPVGYATITFGELDADANRIARGLVAWGVTPGTRLALFVRPGIDFVALVFALLRAGAVIVLIDPGLGRKSLIRCLADAEPEGFLAVPVVHAIRLLLRGKFPQARWNVAVGRRWLWKILTLDQLREQGDVASDAILPESHADDPAAIIFTSGSTGPPKGVLYTQRMFDTQVAEIQWMYAIEPGGADLSCFALFALFNAAMGVTTVFPDMDFSRPASADPEKLLAAAIDWKVTQAFASPALWQNLSAHCGKRGQRISTLTQIFSCGAPVRADVLRSTLGIAARNVRMHTPYGATECLPIATIGAAEVLSETASRTDAGEGICVGRKFESIEWRVIEIADEPIDSIEGATDVPEGEIGELIVRGPQVSPHYVTRTECNADAKIEDEKGNWHRTGDVGYLDDAGRFWYCGRKSQRVETADGPLYTECAESVLNTHPAVRRSALVGIGPRGDEVPVLIVEPELNAASSYLTTDFHRFAATHPQTSAITYLLVHPKFPVDVRHNAKINREQLAQWAAKQLPELA